MDYCYNYPNSNMRKNGQNSRSGPGNARAMHRGHLQETINPDPRRSSVVGGGIAGKGGEKMGKKEWPRSHIQRAAAKAQAISRSSWDERQIGVENGEH